MKRFDSLSSKVLMGFLCVFFLFAGTASAAVTVYAEGAYTTGDTGDLVVYIYADITESNLCSFGVKLGYDADKLDDAEEPLDEKTPPVAEKNEAVWYMGDGTEEGNYDYMDPDTSASGEIIFIGGKLAESDPTAGVLGTRILLGKVTFTRTAETNTEDPGSDPVSYFGITLNYAHGTGSDDFKNFVAVDETIIDGSVSFDHPDFTGVPVKIVKRGDANADGSITNVDMGTVRNLILSGGYVVYADANGDGTITNVDMGTVRNLILSGG